MPPGRTPVETRVISDERLAEVVDGLARHLSNSGQAYWVCPLVGESEKSDAAAAEERARVLKMRFGDDRVGLVHGRMKGAEKDAVMARFAANELAILVATTVKEVGVDVPNATLMIVEGAERFGLAQLHQLRGRVGRGTGKSTCLLIRGLNLTEVGRARRWQRLAEEVREALRETLIEAATTSLGDEIDEAVRAVDARTVDPYTATEQLLAHFRSRPVT